MIPRALEESDAFEVETRPALYVIRTPPELREQWETTLWIRRALLVCLAITAVLVAFVSLV